MDIALFDFDGTITHCDTFTPFVKRAIPQHQIIKDDKFETPHIMRKFTFQCFKLRRRHDLR